MIKKRFSVTLTAAAFLIAGCTHRGSVAPTSTDTQAASFSATTCEKTLAVEDIPNMPLSGKINGVAFDPVEGSAEVFADQDLTFKFYNQKRDEPCSLFPAEKEGESVFFDINGTTELREGVYNYAQDDNLLFGFTYYDEDDSPVTVNYPEKGIFVIESTGSAVTGKAALCFSDDVDSYVAGTFSINNCVK